MLNDATLGLSKGVISLIQKTIISHIAYMVVGNMALVEDAC
jgi:hypothetical protein